MPWKIRWVLKRKREEPLYSGKEKIWIIGLVGGFLLSLILLFLGLNIFRPSKIIERFESPRPDHFKPEIGKFGTQRYIVSIDKFTEIIEKNIIAHPALGCSDMMVINVQLKVDVKDFSTLANRLVKSEGVAKAEVYSNKILINRPCVSIRGMPELWKWEEVWDNVKPILQDYFLGRNKRE